MAKAQRQGAAPRVAVLVPREERIDGTGGAVATWVDRVQTGRPETLEIAGMPVQRRRARSLLWTLDVVFARFSVLIGTITRTEAMRWERAFWLRDFLYVLILARRVRRASVVYVHNRPRYAGFLRRLGYRGRVVLHMHNDPVSYLAPLGAKQIGEIDEYVFCSEYIRRRAIDECGVPEARTIVVWNGVDAVEHPASLVPLSPALLYVGRLQNYKGVDVAVDAVKSLRESGTPATLTVIGGSGSGMAAGRTAFLDELEKVVEGLNERFDAQAVVFRGPLPLPEVLEEMQKHPILLFPSRVNEAFGMVLAEGVSRGCYAVSSGRGGIPEVVEIAGAGLVVDDINGDAFAGAVRTVLATVTDQGRREAAQRVLERLEWPRIREDYEARVLPRMR